MSLPAPRTALRKPVTFFSRLTKRTGQKFKMLDRRKMVNITTVVLIIAAIGTAWGLVLFSGQVNMEDPGAVAKQFTIELQDNHPHAAYELTSTTYHKNIKESDFTNGVAAQVTQQLPATRPQVFSVATPPKQSKDDKKDGSRARILINIPEDGQAEARKVAASMIREHGQWRVQAFTVALGEATRADADASKK